MSQKQKTIQTKLINKITKEKNIRTLDLVLDYVERLRVGEER